METPFATAASALRLSRTTALLWAGVLVTVALHLSLSGRYGYQRDELYFIECARHPAWGYVDQPPLIAFITATSLRLFGDTLVALRFLPAVAAGALVGMSGYAVRRVGGGPYAMALAMTGVALAPFDLAVGSLLTMNAFEPLFWLALALLMFEQIEAPRGSRWVAIGIVVGVGTLNKWSMALYAVVLFAAMLVSPARRSLTPRGVAVAAGIAAAICAPNVAWQASHGWPQFAVLHNASIAKNERVSPLLFLVEQLPLMNPLCAPLWLAGIIAVFRTPRYAGFGIAYGALVATELALHGKVYYMAPVYPAFIAIGAVAIERATRRSRRVRAAIAAGVAVAGIALLPLATPALPLRALLGYQHAIDVRAIKMENHPTGLVPQQFADQLGWYELVRAVSHAVATLTPRERASAAILTGDYGQAAALDFLGRSDHLPPAISGHNQYYLWGARGEHAAIVAVGVPRAVLAREYRSIVRVATYTSPYVLPQNSNLPIYVCRRPRIPLARFWPQLRRYV